MAAYVIMVVLCANNDCVVFDTYCAFVAFSQLQKIRKRQQVIKSFMLVPKVVEVGHLVCKNSAR